MKAEKSTKVMGREAKGEHVPVRKGAGEMFNGHIMAPPGMWSYINGWGWGGTGSLVRWK